MDNTKSAPSSAARGLFTDKNRAWLLAQVIGQPTGVIASIGGVDFDLLPLSTADGQVLLEMVDELSATWKLIRGGEATDADIVALMGDKLPKAVAMTKRVLREAAGDGTDDTLFDEWFAQTRFVPMLRAIAAPVLRANGFGSLADRFDQNPQTPAITSPSESTKPASTETA